MLENRNNLDSGDGATIGSAHCRRLPIEANIEIYVEALGEASSEIWQAVTAASRVFQPPAG